VGRKCGLRSGLKRRMSTEPATLFIDVHQAPMKLLLSRHERAHWVPCEKEGDHSIVSRALDGAKLSVSISPITNYRGPAFLNNSNNSS